MKSVQNAAAMPSPTSTSLVVIPIARIEEIIHFIRDERIILDRDLAPLYGIPTKALKQAVRRNLNRFPPDFMFVLTKTEFKA